MRYEAFLHLFYLINGIAYLFNVHASQQEYVVINKKGNVFRKYSNVGFTLTFINKGMHSGFEFVNF